MSHYDTLRVVPWAEDAVIQGAYRALMRLYHPDANPDPEAQSRAREITRAFAVLSDPEKRAAYDALPRLGEKFGYGAGSAILGATVESCERDGWRLLHGDKGGAAGSVYNLLESAALNHRVEVTSGVLEAETAAQLQAFFKEKRA